ncbi:MAG: molybdopterin cofactor-binding domain-containing protein [Candidatus Bathyarchaeota archaeon]
MKKVGRGVACMWYGVWGEGGVAIVKVDIGGTVTLITGEVDIGQGLNTIMRQIVAEELGVRLETVRIISASDSELTPNVGGAGGSRSTFMGGNAVRHAAAEVKRKVFEAAADILHVNDEALEARDGKIYVKGTPEKFVSFEDVTRGGVPIIATASSESKTTPMNTETGQGNPFQIFCYATQIVDVEVDTETGMVKVLKIVAAHDIGKAINPAFVEGQIYGGIGFGVGQAIMENMVTKDGKTLNPNLTDYLIPTSEDMPEVKPILIEENEPSGPFGGKMIGEPPNLPTAPAIINAIYNAVGVRIMDLPATPEKILKALKEKETGSKNG